MDEVATFYDSGSQQEWERLEVRKTEFAVTCLALEEFLPPAPARVIDIGGGPGRYALWLVAQGYDVSLIDLSARCLEIAQTKAGERNTTIADIRVGSATDLSAYTAESFDSALLLGPLYHLLAEEDRRRALQEAYRILKHGGMLFAAFLNRYNLVRYAAKLDPSLIWRDGAFLGDILDIGCGKSSALPHSFVDYAYFAIPSEVVPLISGQGFDVVDLIGCEGASCMLDDKINELDQERFQEWARMNYRIGRIRDCAGMSDHLLAVATKC